MRLEDFDQAEFTDVVQRMDLGRLVPKVSGQRQPAEPARPSERYKVFADEFSIPLEEFDYLAKRELWEGYVKVLITRVLLKIKAAAKRRKTRVKFFRFRSAPDSHNRRALIFDADGVFVVLAVMRCAHQTHQDRITPVVEFTFEAQVGEFDN